MSRLRVTEIFYSLQGEGLTAGLPTVFIRLTGCPLRCVYCDTEYAFSGGEWLELTTILQRVAAFNPRYVCVTGGEPLAQKACTDLLTALCDQGYRVSLETSGALDICHVDYRVSRVVDIKTPGSGEMERNLATNLACLQTYDQVKFVISDQADYLWSRHFMEFHRLTDHCEILFSPVHGKQSPSLLAEWILQDNLPVRLQLQLHKLLWGEEPGR